MRLFVSTALLAHVLTGSASAEITGTYTEDHFALSPGDTDHADLFLVTNLGPYRILSFGLYLSAGADVDGNGFGLFFDTVDPNDEAAPSSTADRPGYGGAAALRFDPASAAAVGYVPDSEFFVWFPGVLQGNDGDGAVQLVTIQCAHFDPGESIRFGIDVDGFADYLGKDRVPDQAIIATGQAIVDVEGQVFFDIVSGEAPLTARSGSLGSLKASFSLQP